MQIIARFWVDDGSVLLFKKERFAKTRQSGHQQRTALWVRLAPLIGPDMKLHQRVMLSKPTITNQHKVNRN